MCVEQEVRCTGCNKSSTSVYICGRFKKWQGNHKKIVSHRRCGEFSISRPRKQTSLAHVDCPILSNGMRLGDSSNTVASNHQVRQNAYFETCQQPEQEQEQTVYEHNEAFMYDDASQCPSPIQTYPTYAMPYPHYPSWCV
ncbi:hypothetical protein BCON_0740g00030 [Botryotinia convoluta]|uniref:Uncharacterized protein n=1 Tax=Botryotinia convoluta TaxID=54673 RepID=A0A4Z1H453_9HELO|nr:hypothetical protein BCON_0740g00030 [Botryotinia convoluta]